MRFDKKFNQILELHAPNARHDHEARSVGINFGHPRFFNTPNLSYAGVFFFFFFALYQHARCDWPLWPGVAPAS